jgi:serine/threonine-protein kinase
VPIDDETRLSGDNDETRLDPQAAGQPSVSGRTSDAGWLSSSGSIDHGRFAPGTILDNRYRVIGLLGRGGMGEVYRADDLRLGQQVALKFLPPALTHDPTRLAQFHNEVRTARQVSHPNVCRVYDIGEIDGELFITMEYVDGEDLSILLRRIGRLPEDKGIDIARQICAGLAAAHERGVLHRDLKPANIMLDGSGRVRIMDFSLAAAGAVTDVRAGTPAYMAPEQLAGQEVSVRSDIYALGLVLYEIFTGRRAFSATTLRELVEQHRSGTLTAPSTLVRALDPAIDLAIVRCLEPDPVRRPPSAIRVSAALPGGDPLAAALAAGETPSPEMVAAAGGGAAALSVRTGAIWLAVAVGVGLVFAQLSARFALPARIPFDRAPAVLADRAAQIRETLGYTDTPVDRAEGLQYDTSYLNWADRHGRGTTNWQELQSGRPSGALFWYRTARSPLVPLNPSSALSASDPPLMIDGMTLLIMDTGGRLVDFQAAPPQLERATGPTSHAAWASAFAEAGLDPSAFTEVPPSRTPGTYADERKAWKGLLPGTQIPLTIEAAAYRGRIVRFQSVLPWTAPTREPAAPAARQGTSPILLYVLLFGATLAAVGNVRRGRADVRGAFRIGAALTAINVAQWLMERHINDVAGEQERFFVHFGVALFVGLAMYLIYLGLEPFVRRLWPSMLVGWTRALSGRLRDTVIAQDVLIGIMCGAMLSTLDLAVTVLPRFLHQPEPLPDTRDIIVALGTRPYLAVLFNSMNSGLQNALITLFEFAVFRAVFERGMRAAMKGRAQLMRDETMERLMLGLAVAALTIVSIAGNNDDSSQRLVHAVYQAVTTSIVLLVLLRIGLFAAIVMFFTNQFLSRIPLTFDGGSIFFAASTATLVLLAAAAIWAFRVATREVPLYDRLGGR